MRSRCRSSADPLARQLDHFVAVIRGTATPLVGVHDGLQNLRVTAAIAEAVAGGSQVEVPR
jgi:predicted dehydrogenase